jgi:hypothetical protein
MDAWVPLSDIPGYKGLYAVVKFLLTHRYIHRFWSPIIKGGQILHLHDLRLKFHTQVQTLSPWWKLLVRNRPKSRKVLSRLLPGRDPTLFDSRWEAGLRSEALSGTEMGGSANSSGSSRYEKASESGRRVARWFVFKPKIPNLGTFWRAFQW